MLSAPAGVRHVKGSIVRHRARSTSTQRTTTTGREYRNLSQPTHIMAQDDDVVVPVRDGITLLADVYRPAESGRYPEPIHSAQKVSCSGSLNIERQTERFLMNVSIVEDPTRTFNPSSPIQQGLRGRRAPVLRQKLVSRVVDGEKVLGMGGF